MDVHNVTDQYTQLILSQKQTLQKAKSRQGQRPRDRKSRDDAYAKFMLTLMFRRDKTQNDMIYSSFIPPAYPPCITPMDQLRRVAIKDLRLETHHWGTYLLLRSITPPSRMTAIMALMEDENSDVILLQLYQQQDENTRKAADVVDVGTVLLIKEPYFKIMADGEYGLRVDHLSDVVRFSMDDAKIPQAWQPRLLEIEDSAESSKIKGNQAMGESRYWDAIMEYSKALRQPPMADGVEVIKRNRSLAFLKTKQFDAALSDVGFPDFKPKPTEKALFWAAEALYYLERFPESCEVLELLCTNFPHNSQALAILDRARSRSQEQQTGTYNFKQLQAKARKLRPPHLDHATYIGPVEVKHTASKGRGLFVTKAVKAGDLLLCEKAFSHAFAHENTSDRNDGISKTSLVINPETNQAFMGAQADLIKNIVRKVYSNPSVAPAFNTLYHGAYEGVSTVAVDTEPIVDTFLVERIISFNVFGCPISSLVSHKDSLAPKTEEEKAHNSCGIWIRASYINHSCTNTGRRSFIGDMMIVRASRDLEPGTEITFWYHSPVGTSMKDLKGKLKHWEFVCDCTICQDAKATKSAVITKRQNLLESVRRAFNSSALHRNQIGGVERLLDTLNSTYMRPADEVPRLLLWDPQLALAKAHAAQNNMVKSLELVGKVLTSLGFMVVGTDSSSTSFAVIKWGLVIDHLVDVFLLAQTAFAAMKAGKDSIQAGEYARIAYRIIVGEDTSFGVTYG